MWRAHPCALLASWWKSSERTECRQIPTAIPRDYSAHNEERHWQTSRFHFFARWAGVESGDASGWGSSRSAPASLVRARAVPLFCEATEPLAPARPSARVHAAARKKDAPRAPPPPPRRRRPGGIDHAGWHAPGVQPGKAARMCHERGLAQGDVAPVSVTCWEHTIPSRGPTDQGLQGYRVSSLLCPRYVAVTGVAKRLIQTVSGRPVRFWGEVLGAGLLLELGGLELLAG
eukprot:COSAG03_NODE_1172_length_4655_cov_5.592845_1_plen_231_part_00